MRDTLTMNGSLKVACVFFPLFYYIKQPVNFNLNLKITPINSPVGIALLIISNDTLCIYLLHLLYISWFNEFQVASHASHLKKKKNY